MAIRARTRSSGNEVLVVPVSLRAMTHRIRYLIRYYLILLVPFGISSRLLSILRSMMGLSFYCT